MRDRKETENTLEDAVIEFLDCYEKTRREKIDGDFVKWESVKERIAVKLINKEWNREPKRGQDREYRSSSEGDKGEEGDKDYDSDIKSGN